MVCTPVKMPGGATAIVCGPAKRCKCGNRATLECDWKVPARKSGTCDKRLCSRCTYSPAEIYALSTQRNGRPELDKPAIVVTESRHIPVAIRRFVFWRDGGICICGCGSSIDLEYDHCPEWNLLDPKRHDPDKIFLRAKACHKIKSRRNTTEAAKVKRLSKRHRGEKAPTKCPIKSRPFAKGPKQKIPSRPFGR